LKIVIFFKYIVLFILEVLFQTLKIIEMKKALLIVLLLTTIVSNYGFSSRKVEKTVLCQDLVIAYVEIGGIEYGLRGAYPTRIPVTQVDWPGGNAHPGPPNECGYFYTNSNNIMCAYLNFTGPNGPIIYDGPVYQ